MISQQEELERILGGSIEQRDQRSVPGATLIERAEFIYYEDDGQNTAKKQFNLLLDSAGVITAKSGGIVSDSCQVSLPSGTIFHALSYHGDIARWRQGVEAGARYRY